MQIDARENMPDIPASKGGSGREWTPSETRTCYLGSETKVILIDEKGEKKTVTKMAVGLDPYYTWEKNLEGYRMVTMNTVKERVLEDDKSLQGGSQSSLTYVPKGRPHEEVDLRELSENLFQGRPDSAYELIRERKLAEDPVLRLFLRFGGVESKTAIDIEGVIARMDKKEKTALHGSKSVLESAKLMRVAMALHYAHIFTHAACVDGSKAGVIEDMDPDSSEARENAEDQLAPAAYGIWEGVRPFGRYMPGEAAVRATEGEVIKAVEEGMSGGRLPASFNSTDSELYAILSYLKKVSEIKPGEAETDLKERNILIISDNRPGLMLIEDSYRTGHADGMHRKDRGAMLEAICNLRIKLGNCVFLWTPSHSGSSPSSYADLAAKACLRKEQMDDVTTIVKENVYARPCIYERRIWKDGKEEWELADRRAFREGRLRARGYVRKVLGENLKKGATTAGQTQKLWSDMAKIPMQHPKPGEDGMVALEDIEKFNEKIKAVLGLRSFNTVGVSHDAAWRRRRRVEEEKGEVGPAVRSGHWGCAACRKIRNERRQEIEKRPGQAERRRARTQAQRWIESSKEYDDEEKEMALALDNTRHVIVGQCEGANETLRESLDESVKDFRNAVRRGTGKVKGGLAVLQLAVRAQGATMAEQANREVSDLQYEALSQVAASTIPSWEVDAPGETAPKTTVKDMKISLRRIQSTVGEMIAKHIKIYSTAQIKFVMQREESRGWMKNVLHAWKKVAALNAGKDVESEEEETRNASGEEHDIPSQKSLLTRPNAKRHCARSAGTSKTFVSQT